MEKTQEALCPRTRPMTVGLRTPESPLRIRRWPKLLTLFGVLACAFVAYVMLIHDFLAVNRPVQADVLVVEAWISDDRTLVQNAADVIRGGNYRTVFCVATEAPQVDDDHGGSESEHLAASLIKLGVDSEIVHALAPQAARDRTYSGALAIRSRLRNTQVRSINVFTSGVHARKSWILYQKALPPDVSVGIISGKHSIYPVPHWWRSGRGIYLIVRNTFGYLYALMHARESAAD
jgi:hypothetical protein